MRTEKHQTISRSALLVLLSIPLLCIASPICSRNEQCDDGNPDTYNFCWKAISECYSVSKSGDQSKPYVTTKLETVIREINAKPLSIPEKRVIISAASTLLSEINPHRFLQLNLFKVDIVSELRNYSESLDSPALRNETNFQFHETMKQIFQRMNDRHTGYYPPLDSVAILGFRVEEFFDAEDVDEMGKPRTRYVVADVVTGLAPKSARFRVGAEILEWDGDDIAAVVKKLGKNGYGSNEAAQMSLAVTELTFRFNNNDKVPQHRTVKIKYRATDGTISTTLAKWMFAKKTQGKGMATSRAAQMRQVDVWKTLRSDLLQSDLHSVAHELNSSSSTSMRCGKKKVISIAVKPEFEELFAAEIVETDTSGKIGRIILPSFASSPTKQLISELVRIMKLMPKAGLILDARSNMGGSPPYAAVLSVLATGKSVDPDPHSIRGSELSFKLARNASKSSDELVRQIGAFFLPALETAVQTGESFTGPILGANFDEVSSILAQLPRAYFGPVVSVVDGLTYSAGDYFAAIQVDKNMSTLVGTSDNVGAGGASSWAYAHFANLSSDLPMLPGDVEFTTAFERNYRSGAKSGAIIESFGVKPQVRYYPTLRDAVEGDCDLWEFLGRLLADKRHI